MATPDELYEAIELVVGGLIDPREIIEKMGPDGADVHIQQNLKVLKRKKRKKQPVEKAFVPGKALAAKLVRRKFVSPTIPGKALNDRLTRAKLTSTNIPGVALKSRLNKGMKIPFAKPRMPTAKETSILNESRASGKKTLARVKLGAAAIGGAGAGVAGGVSYKNRQFNSAMAGTQEPIYKSMTWNADISEIDDEKRQVFGFATVTHVDGEEVIDRQGDYIPLEEIEKAAYNYVLTSRVGGDMHSRDGAGPKHTADLIESVVFSPEKAEAMGIDDCPKYGWWIGMRVNDDDQWNMVKNGERTGISIHGRGKRVDK